jgi:hypothetical protein
MLDSSIGSGSGAFSSILAGIVVVKHIHVTFDGILLWRMLAAAAGLDVAHHSPVLEVKYSLRLHRVKI